MEMEISTLLMSLGLNQLEAEVYTLLLTHDTLTGYRIGQLLGKPTANVYKALDALARKGAVLIEDGNSRTCRVVPANEFLGQLETAFHRTTARAAQVLAQFKSVSADERIYQLQSVSLVFERCRNMLARCTTIAILDIFPHAVELLRDAITEAIHRGVEVFLQVYLPIEIEGAHIVVAHQAETVLEFWHSEQLNAITDGKEALLALMNPELTMIHQAIWSQSLYLSCMMHAGFMREHTFNHLMMVQEDDNATYEMRQILAQHKLFHTSEVPGLHDLFHRFAVSDSD